MLLRLFAVFAAGLAVGVLVNALIYCLPREERLSCNVPVVSLRYLTVELITGVVFVLLYQRYALSVEFILFSYLLSILVAVFFIDLDYRIIPDELVIAALAGSAAAFIYNLFRPFGVYGDRAWWNPLAGILPGAGFLLLVAIIGILVYKSDEVMGMGDVKIFVPVGIFLGWRMCLLSMFLSLLSGGMVSLFLIVAGIKKRKDAIPFGPFIVIATFVVILWGWDIVKWYFKLV